VAVTINVHNSKSQTGHQPFVRFHICLPSIAAWLASALFFPNQTTNFVKDLAVRTDSRIEHSSP